MLPNGLQAQRFIKDGVLSVSIENLMTLISRLREDAATATATGKARAVRGYVFNFAANDTLVGNWCSCHLSLQSPATRHPSLNLFIEGMMLVKRHIHGLSVMEDVWVETWLRRRCW
jgi:hypothetical protein